MKTGIIDEPVNYSQKENDKLGTNDYANALKKFIEKTATPMTVGIQGEWGSGKTSLMYKLWKDLDGDEKNTEIESIWINSWEHSLLKSPEEALISIVSDITNQISNLNPKSKNFDKLKKTGIKIFTSAVKMTAGLASGSAGKEVIDELVEDKADNSIKELKSILENFIKDTIQDTENQDISKISKLVFYIDDLDRIEPKDAVKILELLKNIFSLPHCVFILAIDYQVVIKGLKDKFGEKTEENEREFRSFFDKIIQLPFTMPISKYSVDNYVLSLLKEINFIEDNKNELFNDNIEDILKFTIGNNPRSLKRLINSLSLINILNGIKQEKQNSEIEIKEKLLLFSMVCLQVAYPKIYDLISLKSNIKEWDESFAAEITQKKEETDPQFKDIFEKISKSEDFNDEWEQSLFRICFSSVELKAHATNISKFLTLLHDEEIIESNDQLNNVLTNTAATAVTTNKFSDNKVPKARSVFENIEQTLESFKLIAKSDNKNISDEEITKAIDANKKIHYDIVNLFKNQKDLFCEPKFFRDNISYYIKIKDKNKKRFVRLYLKPKSLDIGALFKDHKFDYRMPKIENITSLQFRVFNKTAKSWGFCDQYNLIVDFENYTAKKDIILSLIKRSFDIYKNSEPLLENIPDTSKLNEKELDKLVIMGSNDYTYDYK